MNLESVEELKKMEATIVDRAGEGYYRCKSKHKVLRNECLTAYYKYCTPTMMSQLQHIFLLIKMGY